MQLHTIIGPEPYGLPLNETTIAQKLKSHGYSTHMIGKVSITGFFFSVIGRILSWHTDVFEVQNSIHI